MNKAQLISTRDISLLFERIYSNLTGFQRFSIINRPYICPFPELVKFVPQGSRVLDIGCGSGGFINILLHSGLITEAVGIDTNTRALEVARKSFDNYKPIDGKAPEVRFITPQEGAALDNDYFDVVSMIDVMHHIPPAGQAGFLTEALGRLKSGGVLIYKDMATRPLWMSMANRLHDLLLARQWIHYANIDDIEALCLKQGMKLLGSQKINMFWYAHELIVLGKI